MDTESIRSIPSNNITRNRPRNKNERVLEYFLRAISTDLRNNSSHFCEIFRSDVKNHLAKLKRKIYKKNGINLNPLTLTSFEENNGVGTDYFDRPKIARFFYQHRYSQSIKKKSTFFKSFRVISRKNPLLLLPSEFCTLDQKSLDDLSEKMGHDKLLYQESSISDKEADRFYRFLEKHNPDKIYEIGGFFGTDPCHSKNLLMLYNIGNIAYQEGWEALIQTVHPNQARFYELCTPYPYHRLTPQPYIDHLNRTSITLYLDGNEFKKTFEDIQCRLEELIIE
ncbi:hypothetical protein GOV12_01655 [Candidatus Pacearchaeota archaeon]|nr:hypothetical protein [Candidatus Pacearchaeota archaeon]